MTAFHALSPAWAWMACSILGRTCVAMLRAAWPIRKSLTSPGFARHSIAASGTSATMMWVHRTSAMSSFFSATTSAAMVEKGASTLATAASNASANLPSTAAAPCPAAPDMVEKPDFMAATMPPPSAVLTGAAASVALLRSFTAAFFSMSNWPGAGIRICSGVLSAGSTQINIISFTMTLQICCSCSGVISVDVAQPITSFEPDLCALVMRRRRPSDARH
mmetsp:Transcript_62810/g.182201  ORF Transcript_62810/g.182201 Transcript_62810/m.182201 type:complete len:220 (+) Transcript_62810:719-1378(+)